MLLGLNETPYVKYLANHIRATNVVDISLQKGGVNTGMLQNELDEPTQLWDAPCNISLFHQMEGDVEFPPHPHQMFLFCNVHR